MGDIANEPSMEEILSSIKRIIAEEGESAVSAARSRAAMRKPRPATAEAEEVLELTEAVVEAEAPVQAEPKPVLVAEAIAEASRQKLASLSALIVKPEAPGNTLEGLVCEMLRPMLKEWLDANLPELVEKIVAREVARITDRSL